MEYLNNKDAEVDFKKLFSLPPIPKKSNYPPPFKPLSSTSPLMSTIQPETTTEIKFDNKLKLISENERLKSENENLKLENERNKQKSLNQNEDTNVNQTIQNLQDEIIRLKETIES